jgi:hypothetical protein
MAINAMAIGRVSLQRVSRGGSPGLHVQHHTLPSAKGNKQLHHPTPITRLQQDRHPKRPRGGELQAPPWNVEVRTAQRLQGIHAKTSVRNDHAPEHNLAARQPLIRLYCMVCTSPIQYMHLLGSLAFPTSHKLWFTCGLRSRTSQPHKSTSETSSSPLRSLQLYQPKLCHGKKLEQFSLGLDCLTGSLSMHRPTDRSLCLELAKLCSCRLTQHPGN